MHFGMVTEKFMMVATKVVGRNEIRIRLIGMVPCSLLVKEIEVLSPSGHHKV